MWKKSAFVLSLAACIWPLAACSGEKDAKDNLVTPTAYNAQDLNPTGDPKVQEGIDRQRQEYEDRQAAAREAKKGQNYTVEKTGGGHGGVPTSGGYPPPGNSN